MELSSTADGVHVGDTIGGCRLASLIGRGGMGAVYEAVQASLDRRVAVKILTPSKMLREEELLARFLQEARLAARLNHPSIVQMYDVGKERGIPYMIMEFVEGVTLRDILRGQPTLPVNRLFRIATQVTRGLSIAHRAKIVHRDIKPANILLTPIGEAKIADFGAACSFASREAPGEVTLGTPAYAAPEVILGKPSDGRADMYSLGLILYRAGTGVEPFPGEDMEEILRAQVEVVPRPVLELRPRMHPGLAGFIDRLCAKKPADRYSSHEAADLLDRHPEWGKEKSRAVSRPDAAEGTKRSELAASPPAPALAAAPASPPPAATAAPSSAPARTAPTTPAPGSPDSPAAAAEPKKQSFLHASLLKERPGAALAPPPPSAAESAPAAALSAAAAKAEPAAPKPPAPPVKKDVDPRLAELCVQARFFLMKKQWAAAEERFREAINLDAECDMALLGLARLYTETSRLEEAAGLVLRALAGGHVQAEAVLQYPHFAPLRTCKELVRLLGERSR